MSHLNFELNIQNYSLLELKNIFNIQQFNLNNIQNKVSLKINKINALDICKYEKKEIVLFLKNAGNTLLKDLEIMELKQKQEELVNEIEKLKNNIK